LVVATLTELDASTFPSPTVSRLFKQCQVRQILWTARGALVSDQIYPAEDRNCHALNLHFQVVFPSLVKSDAVDRCDHIDSSRGHSDLIDQPWSPEILRSHVRYRSAECCQCIPDPRGIIRTRPDPEIDVASRSRNSMDGERVGSDQEELNVLGDKC
jgi:hypothetical protein